MIDDIAVFFSKSKLVNYVVPYEPIRCRETNHAEVDMQAYNLLATLTECMLVKIRH